MDSKLKSFVNPYSESIGRRYRKAVIVCPGGSYATIVEKEADAVALRFQSYGYQAFVLRYSVGKVPYPGALIELAEAVKFLRENAEKYDIDIEKIYVCGFSAGGHLAASLAVHWDSVLEQWGFDRYEIRPNGIILCYPIITTDKRWRESKFIEELCVDENSDFFSYLAVEKYVSDNTPPVFLWHNADDRSVSVMNSILFSESLAENRVFFEAHFFPKGGHGLSLADEVVADTEHGINDVCAGWFDMARRWVDLL